MRTIRTAKKREEFLSALAETGNVCRAAEAAGISRRALYTWGKEDPTFKAEWEEALLIWCDYVALPEVDRRAIEGVEEPVFYQGAVCGKIRKYSDSLLMFRIKALRSEYSTERKEISGPHGGPLEMEMTMSVEEMDREIKKTLAEIERLTANAKPAGN